MLDFVVGMCLDNSIKINRKDKKMNEMIWIEMKGGVLTGAYYPKSMKDVVVANLVASGYEIVEIRNSR